MSVVRVNLADNSYDILIEPGCLKELGSRCRTAGLTGRAAVVSNPTVSALYAAAALESLAAAAIPAVLIEIPDGEEYKNSATLGTVYDRLIEAEIDRSSFLIALGGGVVGDLAGYAAATYLRGIPFVQVPTTLLAQVDSSVGGKTAIDHPRGKNLIGAFYQPRLVLIDVTTLATLPRREFRAGMAEVIKYGAVLDADFFSFLEACRDKLQAMEQSCLVEVIQRCCELKARIVECDEKETGLRTVLNYGHTLGHAFEALGGYRELIHGEAIAIGMVLASTVSLSFGHATADDCQRIETLLAGWGLPVLPPAVDARLLAQALCTDKKVSSGTISFICNNGIGKYLVERLSPGELLHRAGLEA